MKPSLIRTAVPKLLAKRRVPFLWGPPGVGKSDLVAEIAEDMKIELRDVRVSMLDPVDIRGFPVPNSTKKHMEWIPPDFLPKKGSGLLFLDEANQAPPSVSSSLYQLILNRKVGKYTLPIGWHVMAAGNRAGDRSIVHTQPAALANRFVHLDFDVSNDDWHAWAIKNGIHSDIRSFISFRPNLLNDFDPIKNPRAFPTPRSWAFVNDIYKDHPSVETEFELIKGTVGEGATGEFLAYTRQLKDLPKPEDVIADPENAKVPTSPAARYAVATMFDTLTTKANMGKVMTYMKRLPVEFQVLYVRGALQTDSTLSKTATYTEWCVKNYEVMAG